MAYTIIDIPGYNHNSDSLWHPDFRKYIIESGNEVITLNLPGGKYPVFREWYPIIEQAVVEANNPVILVGHSLGTRAVLLFLEQTLCTIQNVVLIAPFDNSLSNSSFRNGNYANFFEHLIDIKKVKSKVKGEIKVIGSEDDSNIPYTQAQNIAKDLSAELITLPNSGHFLEPKCAKKISEIIVKQLAIYP
jgi:predicted alpha/beta hydrolase family esterase